MQSSKTTKCGLVILIALAGMWLLQYAGTLAFPYLDKFWFREFRQNDATWLQNITLDRLEAILIFIPSAAFPGLIIGSFGFRRPLILTFWTVSVYYLFVIAICFPDMDWMAFVGSKRVTVILADFVSVLLLIGASILVAWLITRQHVRSGS
jgi:hypothetical protein